MEHKKEDVLFSRVSGCMRAQAEDVALLPNGS